MPRKVTLIEKLASALGVVPTLGNQTFSAQQALAPDDNPFPGAAYPDPSQWEDWSELDALQWPERKGNRYSVVPTICFNCESGCGLLAYVDKDSNKVRKFEGNPLHPGSRGRNCAKGPATINQIEDTDRILFPLKRVGERGGGQWERVSWDEALKDIGGRIGQSFDAGRQNNVTYHVGRPGHEGYMDRVLKGWGIDGHNSHTMICSGGARFGYGLWFKHDRPSPDHANAKLILLVSAHLESGHYFNPHAQRILEGMTKGAKLVVLDPRLSNTASMSDLWMPTQPGSEAAIFLAVARLMLLNKTYREDQFKHWTNWPQFMAEVHSDKNQDFETFCEVLLELWKDFTPEFAAREARIPVEQIEQLYELVAGCEGRLAAHTWRSASIGNLGGWQVSRTLQLLLVMTGSVGVKGGTMPSGWNKFHPTMPKMPPTHKFWNTIHFPDEWSVAPYEISQNLPHILRDKNEKIDVYFTRVFNPVWTYPDGFSWIEMLQNEDRIGCHVALTPTWNETAFFADYVLPMGHASERHDLVSYETDSGMWIGFRQPVLREVARREGREVQRTYEVNPGEVWEEDEFWIDLSWQIDPDGSRGIRQYFESPSDSGQPMSLDEYYGHVFDHTPGLKEKAEAEGKTSLEYMRHYGAHLVKAHCYNDHLQPVDGKGIGPDQWGRIVDSSGKVLGVQHDGKSVKGWPTPSGKLEIWSDTMIKHGWSEDEYTLPGYIKSHVHPASFDESKGDMVLVPTFRLPTLIHSRTGAAKWLNEISNTNPMWLHPQDMERLGIRNGDLVRVNTEIGYFIDRVWATEAIKPGVCACSHHIGRWRRKQDPGANRWSSALVDISKIGDSLWRTRKLTGVKPFASSDPDSERIFWSDGGVHQNAAAPAHPDPVSGHNAWLQKVRLEKPHPGDQYGDVVADTEKAYQVYLDWKAMCRPVTDPKQPRRIQWMKRPLAPVPEAWFMGGGKGE